MRRNWVLTLLAVVLACALQAPQAVHADLDASTAKDGPLASAMVADQSDKQSDMLPWQEADPLSPENEQANLEEEAEVMAQKDGAQEAAGEQALAMEAAAADVVDSDKDVLIVPSDMADKMLDPEMQRLARHLYSFHNDEWRRAGRPLAIAKFRSAQQDEDEADADADAIEEERAVRRRKRIRRRNSKNKIRRHHTNRQVAKRRKSARRKQSQRRSSQRKHMKKVRKNKKKHRRISRRPSSSKKTKRRKSSSAKRQRRRTKGSKRKSFGAKKTKKRSKKSKKPVNSKRRKNDQKKQRKQQQDQQEQEQQQQQQQDQQQDGASTNVNGGAVKPAAEGGPVADAPVVTE